MSLWPDQTWAIGQFLSNRHAISSEIIIPFYVIGLTRIFCFQMETGRLCALQNL